MNYCVAIKNNGERCKNIAKNDDRCGIHKSRKELSQSNTSEQIREIFQQFNFTVLDLFCGAGGFSHGFKTAGLNIIGGIDICDICVKSYAKNQNHLTICRDLTKYPPEQFLTENNIHNIDILIGSPPCCSFSIAGRRDVNDKRSNLFEEYIKYLNYFNPQCFLLENVVGILSMKNKNGTKYIDIIMNELNKNYNCVICKLCASNFDVPQKRIRVFIYGIRKDLNIFPTQPKDITDNIPVRDFLLSKEDFDKTEEKYLSAKAIQGILRRKEINMKNGKGFGAQFLDLNKPCYTICSNYWHDGYAALINYSNNFDENSIIRRLTLTELKRIQSFSDDYIFEGSKKDQITQIGNAVPPKMAYYFAKHILKEFISR